MRSSTSHCPRMTGVVVVVVVAVVLVADEIRGASQVVVHELPEEHLATLAPDTAISFEVTA